MNAKFAKVAIDSPLPQLDRLFDYSVPDHLAQVATVGVRVRVPFGKSGSLNDGFIVEFAETSDFASADIAEVVSSAAVLTNSQYLFLRAVADRQAGTLSEMLKLAVPKRSVRVEKAWLSRSKSVEPTSTRELSFSGRPVTFHGRLTALAEPRLIACHFAGQTVAESQNVALQGWIALFVSASLEQLALGKSSILVVPDFRDQHRLREALASLGLSALVTDYASDQVGSERYVSYLSCLDREAKIIIGSRGAIYAPSENVGLIAVWDDADQSLHEPTAPYIHSREVALLRQQLQSTNILFAGHSRSAEIQRLLEIGYLTDISATFSPPKIAVTEPGLRVDSTSYQAVKEALQAGGGVLVQVAATGNSVSCFCGDCSTRSQCGSCNGPLFIDDAGTARCRWCSALNLNARCLNCGSAKLRPGAAGSTRTAAELGKAFPGVKVVEATFNKRVLDLPQSKCLVVATPGAEPVMQGGYQAVVLLDGQKLLGRDTLRAAEQAVDSWSNAVSLLAPNGRAVGVGLASPLGQRFALWDHGTIAREELRHRRELNFPPHHRLASVTGPRKLIDAVVRDLPQTINALKPGSIEVLGPLALDQEIGGSGKFAALPDSLHRYLIRFDYSLGETLATELRARALKANSGQRSVNQNTGRTSRAVRVKMDDSEVI